MFIFDIELDPPWNIYYLKDVCIACIQLRFPLMLPFVFTVCGLEWGLLLLKYFVTWELKHFSELECFGNEVIIFSVIIFVGTHALNFDTKFLRLFSRKTKNLVLAGEKCVWKM